MSEPPTEPWEGDETVRGGLDAAGRLHPPAPPPAAPPPAAPPPAEAPAERTVGPWRLERELGRGSHGVVWLAQARGLSAALKLLGSTHLDPTSLARFEREARLGRALDHPGIVRVLDAGQHAGRPWLAMEYCPGPTLYQRLREQGPLAPDEAARLALELARALAHAHGLGVIHRDLKPGNVLLQEVPGEGRPRPRIVDFGLARGLDRASLTRTGELMGTPAYMAPEQFEDGKRVDEKADVWALGELLYECLCGRRPFQAQNVPDQAALVRAGRPPPPSQLRPGLDPRLEAICLGMLVPEPAARPRAQEVAAALEDLLRGERAETHPAERGPGWPRPRLVLTGGAAAVTLAAGLGLWGRGRPEVAPPPPAAEAAAAEPPALLSQRVLRALSRPAPWRAEQEQEARQALERLRGTAEEPRLRLELARWLGWRGRFDEALELLSPLLGPDGPWNDRAGLTAVWTRLLRDGSGGPLTDGFAWRDPDSPSARCGAALLAWRKGDRGRALDLINPVWAGGLDEEEALVSAAEVLLSCQEHEQLADRIAPLRDLAGRDPRAALILMRLELGADPRSAHAHMHQALALLDGRGELFGLRPILADVCRVNRHVQGYLPVLERLIAWRADSELLLRTLEVRFATGDVAGARADLDRLLEQPDQTCLAAWRSQLGDHRMCAWIDQLLGSGPGGLREWEATPALARDSHPALVARAARAATPEGRAALTRALVAAAGGAPPGELGEALERTRLAAPQDPAVALELARLAAGRDLPQLGQALAQARALAPTSEPELTLLEGLSLYRAGRPTAGQRCLSALAERAPASGPGLCARGELALQDGDWDQALACARRAQAVTPELLPATVLEARALVHLDPLAADALIASAIRERCGYEEAHLVGAGIELATRATLFLVAATERWHNDMVTRGRARLDRVFSLSESTWCDELLATTSCLLAPYMREFGMVRLPGEQAVARGLERDPRHGGLRLAQGYLAISVRLTRAPELPPPETCLEVWSAALREEPLLRLPVAYADRFACFYRGHPLIEEWLSAPSRPFARFLEERLRAPR